MVALGAAVVGSVLFATGVAVVRTQFQESSTEVHYPQRLLEPDRTALVAFVCFVGLAALWFATGVNSVGPQWLGTVLSVVLVPVGLPFLLLAPLAIRFHWAVVLGLALTVLWMSLLGNLVSDVVHGRSLPLLGR